MYGWVNENENENEKDANGKCKMSNVDTKRCVYICMYVCMWMDDFVGS